MQIVPIILAAGGSTRMGQAKALCDFDGKPALQLALEACRDAGLADPIVVLGHEAETIRAAVPMSRARVVVNPDPDRGQTSSLKVGLQAVGEGADGFLLYPCDHPLITAAEIAPLLAEFRHLRGQKDIFIPSCNLRRGHPVLFDISVREDFMRLSDEVPARTVYNSWAARIYHVEVPSIAILMDMDTPEDYAKCLEEYRRRQEDLRRAKE